MDESLEKAIQALKQRVEQKAKELMDAKKAVNQVCISMGEKPIYETTGDEIGLSSDLKGHEYYMKPLATVITNILERRGEQNGPMTVKEIYEQMKAGGYLFETKNDENAMRNIRISMAKNTQTFHKLPNGKFGLLKWFPDLKESEESKKGKKRKRKRYTTKTTEEAIQSIESPKQEYNQSLQREPVLIHKRRGRPPKVKSQEDNQILQEESQPVIKRGHGRSRKVKPQEEPTE
jgi:hypothetical protein